jgi:hypothetical protein
MSSLPVEFEFEPLARSVRFETDSFVVSLADGRELSVPYAWFPTLLDASPDQRADYRLIGDGVGIHWPQIDEDLSIAGLLRGTH